jgi:glycosyltransferase involved in cell wall biosynthesis
MRIACVIPAFNERGSIYRVLRPAIDSGIFDKVVVVDDASEDDTALYVQSLWFEGIAIYRLPRRSGKSRAVSYALHALRGQADLVCLLDADLVGLTTADLDNLAAPVLTGVADTSLSSRNSYRGLWCPSLDIFTGERVMAYSVLVSCGLESLDSMEMELAINDALIKEKARIAVVPWPHVTNPTKAFKYGLRAGMAEEWRMYREFWKRGVVGIVRQRRELQRQVV